MTPDSYNYEVSWSLTCDGLSAPITGGAPYSETHAVPPGSCALELLDSYGDGWQGATWTAPSWTAQNFTLAGGTGEVVSFYAGPQPPSPPTSPPPPPRPPLSCGAGTEVNGDSGQCEIACTSGGRRAAEEGAVEGGAAEGDGLEASPVRQLMEAYLARHPDAAAINPELFTLMETGLKAISSLTTHPGAASMMGAMTAQLFLQPAPA